MVNLKAKPFFLSDEKEAWVRDTLVKMTEDQKIGQLFCVNFRDYSEKSMDEMLSVMEPGAVMYRPGDAKEQRDFSRLLREKCHFPMLIAANLEAGGDGIVKGGTQYGSPMAVAATDDDSAAAGLARVCAEEGSAVGANWAFAPIVDIDYNWRNPIMNTRTFGSDPLRVARMGKAYVDEIQRQGFAACIKHFPGDGRDDRDQHLHPGLNDCTTEEWFSSYGMVYQTCIDAGALTCMVGHFALPFVVKDMYPEIRDEDILPASQSREVVTELLREKLGFNGLVCTDSSTMAGYTQPQPRWDALPASIMAGCDMIVFNKNMEEDVEFMRDALHDGRLSPERLEEAVMRILAVKATLGLEEEKKKDANLSIIGNPEFLQMAKDVANRSITLVKEQAGVLPITPERYPRVLVYPIEDLKGNGDHGARPGAVPEMIDLLKQEGFEITVFSPDGEEEGNAPRQREMAKKYDLILYIGNLASRSNSDAVRIEWHEPMWADAPGYINVIPTVFVSLDYPYLLPDVPRVKTYINTFCSSSIAIRACVDKLLGRSAFLGKAPSDFFCGKWDTRL